VTHWLSRPAQRPIEELDPAQVAEELGAVPGVLVDVREVHEWHAGRAASAVHIPLGQLAGRAHELPRNQPVFLICASGNRSKVAAQILVNAGFQRAVNVRGGTIAWMRGGLPMTR
jgi:rhodanese-related sulfurtransferase